MPRKSQQRKSGTVEKILSNPIYGAVGGLITLGIAFSGKLDVTATKVLFGSAWLISVWSIYNLPVITPLSAVARFIVTIFSAGVLGVALYLLLVWLKPIRDLDTAELAFTTKCQEVIVINKYRNMSWGKGAESEDCPDYLSDHYHLVRRGILECGLGIAARPTNKGELAPGVKCQMWSSCFL